MAFSSIRSALATRLTSALTAYDTTVHEYARLNFEMTGTDEFANLYVDASNRVNVVIIERMGFADMQVNEDSSVIRRHVVHLNFCFSHSDTNASENTFNTLLETAEADLQTGDRTLGGSCLTYSLPEINNIDFGKLGKRQDAYHVASIKINIDEVL